MGQPRGPQAPQLTPGLPVQTAALMTPARKNSPRAPQALGTDAQGHLCGCARMNSELSIGTGLGKEEGQLQRDYPDTAVSAWNLVLRRSLYRLYILGLRRAWKGYAL